MRSRRSSIVSSTIQQEPPWYGTVCPVVWEDGGSNPASYPIKCHRPLLKPAREQPPLNKHHRK